MNKPRHDTEVSKGFRRFMAKTKNQVSSAHKAASLPDLRGWLEQIRQLGKLKEIRGASWDLEIGALTDLNAKNHQWTLLFDEIQDYPPGYRIVTGCLLDASRVALALGLSPEMDDQQLVKTLRKKLTEVGTDPHRFQPQVLSRAAFLENSLEGSDVDVMRFPAPKWNEHDGGRYLGTADAIITRDPESGWVNVGTYRLMVHDGQHLGVLIHPSHHGRLHAEKYWAQGEMCPVAISLAHHPLIGILGGLEVPTGTSEYEYAGGLLGRGYPVVPGPLTGLPIPAESEIVLEGHLRPETKAEGPYGEFQGYYTGGTMENPVIKVQTMHFRDDPILLGTAAGRPLHDYSYFRCPIRAAMLWSALEAAGIPGIRGVWCHPAGYSRALTVVSIKQAYMGHAEQAGLVAAQLPAGIFGGKYVVVVDDDIDPSNTNDVLWAICSRTDPASDIEFIRNSWGMNLDPMVHQTPGQESAELRMSRSIINACRPFARALKGDFPEVVEPGSEVRERVLSRWPEIIT